MRQMVYCAVARWGLLAILMFVGCHGGGEPHMVTVEYPIAASADDGYFARSGVGVWSTSADATDVIFGKGPGLPSLTLFRMFLRFELNIPPRATITSANIIFEATRSAGTTLPTLIKLIDADDCGDINSFAPDQTNMSFTGDVVGWSVSTWTNGEMVISPDIATLVQAFIDRPGYEAGQYMGVIIPEHAVAAVVLRGAASFDCPTCNAPTLRITYGAPSITAVRVRETILSATHQTETKIITVNMNEIGFTAEED